MPCALQLQAVYTQQLGEGAPLILFLRGSALLHPRLQACSAAPGLLLTAGQEALLGELVQAATRAQQPQQQPQQQEAALRRGSAARQLLFDCNLRLVLHTRRQLLGSVQLPASLHQVS